MKINISGLLVLSGLILFSSTYAIQHVRTQESADAAQSRALEGGTIEYNPWVLVIGLTVGAAAAAGLFFITGGIGIAALGGAFGIGLGGFSIIGSQLGLLISTGFGIRYVEPLLNYSQYTVPREIIVICWLLTMLGFIISSRNKKVKQLQLQLKEEKWNY